MLVVAVGLFSEEGTIHRLINDSGQEQVDLLKSRNESESGDSKVNHALFLFLPKICILHAHVRHEHDHVKIQRVRRTSDSFEKLASDRGHGAKPSRHDRLQIVTKLELTSIA